MDPILLVWICTGGCIKKLLWVSPWRVKIHMRYFISKYVLWLTNFYFYMLRLVASLENILPCVDHWINLGLGCIVMYFGPLFLLERSALSIFGLGGLFCVIMFILFLANSQLSFQ